MNRFPLRSLLLLLMLHGVAGAAEPLVKFPTGDAKWTITFGYPAQKTGAPEQPAGPRITKAEITRKEGIRQDRIWWSNARSTEVWTLESARVRVFENPENGAVYVVPFNDSTMTSFIPRDFDDTLFSWLAVRYREGSDTFKGRDCLIYAGEVSRVFAVPGLSEKPIQLSSLPHKAWIDAQTRQPVALDNGMAMHEFTFEPAPADPLVMPERLRTELDRYISDNAPSKRIERLRARNGRSRP